MTTISSVDTASGATPVTLGANPSHLANAIQDRFLTLLVTQLQNQDPLNPMDNAQVTSQMAQLSTVHGIAQLNSTLQSLSGQLDKSQSMQAAGLIGKGVLVPGSKVALGGQGDIRQAMPFGIDVVAAAEQVVVTLLDASGQAVHHQELGPLAAGVVSLSWDGTGEGGVQLPDGAYFIQAQAVSERGMPVPVTPLTYGTVSSVNYGPGGARIGLGLAGTHDLQDIRKIM